MPQMDDLALLPALDTLLEQASVTRAAERHGLSQPAMSRILARLRERFGDPLLVRDGGCWRLTPRAQALRAPVRDLLARATALHAADAFDPACARRSFHVLIPDVVAAVVLPTIQAAFRSEAPDCRLALAPWPARAERIDNIDAAIASEPSIFPTFRMAALLEDEDVVVFRATDGFPSRETMFSRPHVSVVPIGFAGDLADDWLGAHGVTRPVALVVPHYLQALHIIARSDLLGVLPRRLVSTFGTSLSVGWTNIDVPQQPDRYWLLHPPHLDSDPANRWLRGLIRRAIFEGGPNGEQNA